MRNLFDICVAAFECERRSARSNAQLGSVGKVIPKYLRDASGEIIVLRIAAHVDEWQHRDGVRLRRHTGFGDRDQRVTGMKVSEYAKRDGDNDATDQRGAEDSSGARACRRTCWHQQP